MTLSTIPQSVIRHFYSSYILHLCIYRLLLVT